MTVRQLLANLDSRELTEWRAFHAIEPFALNADKRTALLAAMVGNVAGGKKSGDSFDLDDFVPNHDAVPVETQSPEQIRDMARMITEVFGGTIVSAPTPPASS